VKQASKPGTAARSSSGECVGTVFSYAAKQLTDRPDSTRREGGGESNVHDGQDREGEKSRDQSRLARWTMASQVPVVVR
jgi:hypothetical protein